MPARSWAFGPNGYGTGDHELFTVPTSGTGLTVIVSHIFAHNPGAALGTTCALGVGGTTGADKVIEVGPIDAGRYEEHVTRLVVGPGATLWLKVADSNITLMLCGAVLQGGPSF